MAQLPRRATSKAANAMEANPHCFVCNSRLGVSTRNAVQIFSEQTNLDRPVITVLSSVLSLDVKPSAAHSKLLCKKCLRSINEFEEHETRLAELRIEIISNYNRTAVKYNKPPIPLEHEMEILEDENSAEEFVEETKSHQIEPKNQVDSYKTEDCSAPIKQPECDADVSVESQLARMHQQPKPTDPKTQQLKVMTTPQLVKISTIGMKHTTQTIGVPVREQANLQRISDPLLIKSDHMSYQIDEDSVSSQMEDDVESIEYSRSDCAAELSEQQLEENTTALLEAAAMAEQRNEAQDSDIVINIKVEPDVDGLNRRLGTFRKRKPIRKIKEEPDLLLPLVARAGNNYACLLCHNSEEGPPKGDLSLQDMLDAKDITAHMKTAHDQRLYICDICGADFRKRNEMSEHLEEHVATEEGDFQCETCNRIFSNLRLFRIHRRMHYPQNKLWPCDTCGKKYSSRNLLDEHVNTHTGNRPYQCHHCAKDFASKYTMAAHLKTHTMRPRPHSCTMCGKSFFSTQNLAQHERTHSGIKNYICNTCGKGFGTPHNLEVHNIVHTGYKPFICRTCGKAFARRAEIRDHERTHTGERPYSCDLCGSQFSQRSNLQSHKRATHYDDKRHKCEMCGKCFKRRRLLDYHIKATHTGERPFKCDVCASTFVYPEHFKKHQRIHSGEKPYLCEVCGKAFNSRDNRNAHRFVHSDKKPYECLVCGQGFMRKPLLYAHMQSQGHLNDTIVVNQPRFQPDDEQVMTLETLTEERSLNANNGDSKLYLTELKEHIIIQTAGDEDIYEEEDNDRGDSDENMTEEHLIIDGPVNFSDEQDFGEENTIITLEDGGDDFSEQYLQVITDDLEADQIEIVSDERRTIETSEGPIQLVQIRIPGVNGKDNRAWVNIVQSSKA